MSENQNSENTNQKTSKKLGAKLLSKIAMIFAGIWIASLTIIKGFGKIELSITDIIYSGVAIAAVWTPTYFSIFLDKVKDIKLGGAE